MTGGFKMSAGTLSLLAATGILLVGGASARAADLGGNCCADLEERIAELESTTVRKGNRKVKLEVSGQINEALMFWDDGVESNVYQGTNDTARSRVRFKGSAKIVDGWTAGYLLELGIRTNRLNRTDQDQSSASPGTPDVRHSMWYIESKQFGKGSVGLTSQSTDGVTEVNTANMNHFARPSLSKWNGNFNVRVNGQRTTEAAPGNGNEWRDFLAQSGFTGDNVPGEGDRRNLIRYDTPEIAGFTGTASWGEDDFWDMALRYKGEFSGFKLAAAAGYAAYSDGNAITTGTLGNIPGSVSNLRGCASSPEIKDPVIPGAYNDVDCSEFGASASVMHIETGLFVTGAYGIRMDDNRKALFLAEQGTADVDDDDEFWAIQAGIERKFNPLGKTTLYGEYYLADTGAGISGRGSDSTFNFAGILPAVAGNYSQVSSEIWYWGLGVNQHIEAAAMDVYLAYRHHEGDIELSNNGSASGGARNKVELDGLDVVMGGAMIKF